MLFNAVTFQVPVHLCGKEAPFEFAAADALADGDMAGVGGFWIPQGKIPKPENLMWFAWQFSKADLPCWFWRNDDGAVPMKSCIAALEALAQLVLMRLRLAGGQAGRHVGRIRLRQQCDNQGVVAGNAKQSSMKKPLCYVIQATSFWACKLGVALKLSHVSGARNVWADGLSRGPGKAPELWGSLNPANRKSFCAKALLHAPWSEVLHEQDV